MYKNKAAPDGRAPVVVPITNPLEIEAKPVVVELPEMVRPPAPVPLPIVEDASEYNPALKPMSVEVALDAEVPKVDAVNGYA